MKYILLGIVAGCQAPTPNTVDAGFVAPPTAAVGYAPAVVRTAQDAGRVYIEAGPCPYGALPAN